MTRLALKPADVVLIRSRGLGAKIIRKFSTSRNERPTEVNHTTLSAAGLTTSQLKAGVARGTDVVPWIGCPDLVVDAQPPRVSFESLWHRYGPYGTRDDVAVYRAIGLTDEERAAVAMRALRYVGTRYGWGKILLHGLGLARWAALEGRPICSYEVGVAYEDVLNWTFGAPGNGLQPDDVHDYCELTLGTKWERVHDLTPLGGL